MEMLHEKKIKIELDRHEGDEKNFLELCSPLNLTKALSDNQINNSQKAILSGLKSLSLIRKDYGAETLKDFITVWLIKLNEYVFGRSDKQMTEYQISETVLLIIDSYYYLNIAEIGIIFKKIKTGAYGKVFGELNGMFILDAFAQYQAERMKALQLIDQENQKEGRKKEENNDEYVPMPESVRRLTASLFAKNK